MRDAVRVVGIRHRRGGVKASITIWMRARIRIKENRRTRRVLSHPIRVDEDVLVAAA